MGRDRMLGGGGVDGQERETKEGLTLKTILMLSTKTFFNIIATNSRKLNEI